MTLDDQKEQFSYAYVHAIGAAARVSVTKPAVDTDSVDLSLKSKIKGTTFRSPQLDIQVKCTETIVPSGDDSSFPLKRKNYDELSHDNLLVPRILVVVLVPTDLADWLNHSEPELAIRRCGYWISLRGKPATSNEYSVNVRVPRVNVFNVEQLSSIMTRIADGETP